jgi:acetylornithine deacetylase/succinyl-diaminopimelate desuccinylase-like protein
MNEFLGILQAGDFYNRLPHSCRIVGTRRFAPEIEREDMQKELLHAVASAIGDQPVAVWVDTSKGNDGYRLSPDEGCRLSSTASASHAPTPTWNGASPATWRG